MYNNSQSWYALYTRARHEKKVCMYLDQKGINAYLPMTSEIRKWSDRKRKVELPLFPSYVFVQLEDNNFWSVNDLPGAIKIVGIGNKPSPIPDTLIESLKKVKDDVISVEDLNLYKGEPVRITDGKFMGIEGEFLRKGSKNILAITVEIMNRVVIIELKADHVQRLESLKSRAVINH